MRRLIVVLAAIGLLTTPAALARGTFPEKIALPNAFAPEGIEIARETFFVGSDPDRGDLLRQPAHGRRAQVIIPGAAPGTRGATGIEYDRGNAVGLGGGRGTARVYDVKTGALIREYQLDSGSADIHQRRRRDEEGGVLHGLAAARDLAHLDRQARRAGRPHDDPADGRLPARRRAVQPQRHRRHRQREGADRRPDRREEALPDRSGERRHQAIDTGTYDLANGDGLLLHGKTLYVVQNRSNQIAVFRLSKDLTKATFIKVLTDPDFDVPTTIDQAGKRLYAVNARFGTSTPTDQHYDIVKVG